MTAIETSDLICKLTVNLKTAMDSNDELSEDERIYLDGLCAGLKLASETIRSAMESNDLGDYPDTIQNQFDNMTGSMNL